MSKTWENGTAPTNTTEVLDFVEKHVHEEFTLTAGVKHLLVQKHVASLQQPMILRKPTHSVHKVLKESSQKKAMKAVAADNISLHLYKLAATIASSRRGGGGNDEDDDASPPPLPPPSAMFCVAGLIGGPEYDHFHKYRHDMFVFKEDLAHEVKELVLEKQKLDQLKKELRQQHHHHHLPQSSSVAVGDIEEEEDSDSGGDSDRSGTTTIVEDYYDHDDEGILSSSSTVGEEDDNEEEIID